MRASVFLTGLTVSIGGMAHAGLGAAAPMAAPDAARAHVASEKKKADAALRYAINVSGGALKYLGLANRVAAQEAPPPSAELAELAELGLVWVHAQNMLARVSSPSDRMGYHQKDMQLLLTRIAKAQKDSNLSEDQRALLKEVHAALLPFAQRDEVNVAAHQATLPRLIQGSMAVSEPLGLHVRK